MRMGHTPPPPKRKRSEPLTLLPLLQLEGKVEGADGEVHCLGVGLAHGAEQVEDVAALLPHQAGQQLWYPWQPQDRGDADVVLVHSLCQCTLPEGEEEGGGGGEREEEEEGEEEEGRRRGEEGGHRYTVCYRYPGIYL